jgi:hypothetical protein
MIVHPAYPGGARTKAVSSQIDLVPTLLALTGKPAEAVARASGGLKGRDLSKVLSALQHRYRSDHNQGLRRQKVFAVSTQVCSEGSPFGCGPQADSGSRSRPARLLKAAGPVGHYAVRKRQF